MVSWSIKQIFIFFAKISSYCEIHLSIWFYLTFINKITISTPTYYWCTALAIAPIHTHSSPTQHNVYCLLINCIHMQLYIIVIIHVFCVFCACESSSLTCACVFSSFFGDHVISPAYKDSIIKNPVIVLETYISTGMTASAGRCSSTVPEFRTHTLSLRQWGKVSYTKGATVIGNLSRASNL